MKGTLDLGAILTPTQIIPIVCLLLCVGACRRSATTSGVSIEVDKFASVKLRPPGNPADLQNARLVGNPTGLQIKEAAEVIGRIAIPWKKRVDFVRFTEFPDGLHVEAIAGHEVYYMKKVRDKWVIDGTGRIY